MENTKSTANMKLKREQRKHLSTEATYEDRKATIEFKFDDKLNMNLWTFLRNTQQRKFGKSGMNTVLG